MKKIDELIKKRLGYVAFFCIASTIFFTTMHFLKASLQPNQLLSATIHSSEYLAIYLLCRFSNLSIKTISTIFILLIFQIFIERIFIVPVPGFAILSSAVVIFLLFFEDSILLFNLYSLCVFLVLFIANKYGFISETPKTYIAILTSTICTIFMSNILLSQRKHLIDKIFSTAVEKGKYNKSNLSVHDISKISDEITAYLTDEEDHFAPEFKARNLASRIGIPLYKLSQVLNIGMGQSFNELLNNYRIEEVKRRLIAAEYIGQNIIDVAFDCGFSTKSSFNASFKKNVGITPKEFREQNNSKKNKSV